MKKEFEYYLSVYSYFLKNRNTTAEKQDFINKNGGLFGNAGYEVKTEQIDGVSIIEIGDVENSRYVVMAGYDIPGKTVLPGFRYYPGDLDKSKKYEVLNIAVQIAILAVVAIIGVLILNKLQEMKLIFKIIGTLLWMAVLYVTYIFLMGPVKDNVTKNNCLSLMYMLADSNLKKVAFVLADRSSINGLGLRKYIEKNSALQKDKKVLVLDSLGEGETYILGDGKLKTDLKQVVFERKTHSILSYLEHGYMLVTGYMDGENVYVQNHRNNKCRPVDINRLRTVCEKTVKSLEK